MNDLFVFELAALAAAASWALASLVSSGPSRALGAIAFNRVRMALVLLILGGWSLVSGGFLTIEGGQWLPIVMSGFIGIFLGDTALFLTLNRMGPRRTSMLFSLNAPFSAVLGFLVLGEVLNFREIMGIGIIFAGVFLAIAFGKRASQLHEWESIRGPVWIGVVLGLLAALSQSVGSLIARPVMATGVDPVAVSAVRVAIAAFCLHCFMQLPIETLKPRTALTPRLTAQIAFSGFLGMAFGMTLLLFALSGGELGIISTLSATSPAMVLPLIWLRTGERPALMAWVGAALVIVGSWLLFTN